MQRLDLLQMRKQRQRADIVDDIVTVLAAVFYGKQLSITVLKIRDLLFLVTACQILSQALGADHQRLITI